MAVLADQQKKRETLFQIKMMKKRTVAKRADVAPTGMLDAYTEGPANSAMSDSAKFKEGYKKKGKGKQKTVPKKVETEDDQENKEEPEVVININEEKFIKKIL